MAKRTLEREIDVRGDAAFDVFAAIVGRGRVITDIAKWHRAWHWFVHGTQKPT
jgi:hypothetical protein